MNMPLYTVAKPLAVSLAILLMSGCAMNRAAPEGAANVRADLSRLQSDSQLASRAPVAIEEAEAAVVAAEQPRKDKELSQHLVILAERKVSTAIALAQARLAEDQRGQLKSQGETARLDARTQEANVARSDSNAARLDAQNARAHAELSRRDSAAARSESAVLQQEIDALNAKATERGLVVTLGDVLFQTGKSSLKGGSTTNLSKLAIFLNTYKDRTVIIEGHTDSVGSDAANQGLSQRRANAVQAYLARKGIDGGRLTATGLGESSPVAGNDTATGRQQNRRVEVIISNNAMTIAQ
ncbi:OmpA family protein [Perlucidibaca aquatica]|uniref:OmpA family protein n=1 Tax=Perlucidibaca aquatica TaxID=1852776 RepID=UPI00083AE0D8|nr:OmpA family protein [Perlucidibaca aquatica]